MAKIAALHGGKEIHFPDDMPDDQMDKAIAALHGGPAAPAEAKPSNPTIDPDLAEPLLQALSANKQKQAEEQEKKQQEKDTRRQEDMMRDEEANRAKIGVMEDIASMLNYVREALAPLANQEIPEKLDTLTAAVNNLGETIKEAVKTMLDFAKLPRDIVNAPDGTPKGIQIRSGKPPLS